MACSAFARSRIAIATGVRPLRRVFEIVGYSRGHSSSSKISCI